MRLFGALVIVVIVVLGVAVTDASAAFVDFSGMPPPRDFTALRPLRTELRVPPLLVIACNRQPFSQDPKGGEDYLFRLLAEVELLRMLDTRDGDATISRVIARGLHDPVDPGAEERYQDCLANLGAALFRGAPTNTHAGWVDVRAGLLRLPQLFGVPGTDNVDLKLGVTKLPCERKIPSGSGDNWDVAMALALRVWLRAQPGLRRAFGEAEVSRLKYRMSRVVWLQGSASPYDSYVCALVPESENHRLLIETTRFLHNEQLPAVPPSVLPILPLSQPQGWLRAYDVDTNTDNSVNGVGNELHATLKQLVDHDFVEYNSRPYARFQLIALLNLYDLAQETDIRNRTQAVLDLIAAKFTAESMSGLRTVAFRRRISEQDDRLFDGDNANPAFQVWIDALAPTATVPGIPGDAQEMVLAASSSYHLPDVLVDRLLNPTHHLYLQRFDGKYQMERAFGARDFTISGGGDQTDCPYPTPPVVLQINGTAIDLTTKLEHCYGKGGDGGNDEGSVQPIVLIPRKTRVPGDARERHVGDVIHSGQLPATGTEARSLSCIGFGFACGPWFKLGGRPAIASVCGLEGCKQNVGPDSDIPRISSECNREGYFGQTGAAGSDRFEAWRFDFGCAGFKYWRRCFFVYIRSVSAAEKLETVPGTELRNITVAVRRPPLAYLITHECNVPGPFGRAGGTDTLFDDFVKYLAPGSGAQAPAPPLPQLKCLEPLGVVQLHLTGLCSPPQGCVQASTAEIDCELALAATLPTFAGPIRPGQHVTFQASPQGLRYTVSPPEAIPRGLSASGSLADIRAYSKAADEIVFNDPDAAEQLQELDTGGIVRDTRDAPRWFQWSADVLSNGLVTGGITKAEQPETLRSVTVEADDATAYGRGCALFTTSKLQGCYTTPCYFPPCTGTGPQTHQWKPLYTKTFPPNGSPLAFGNQLPFLGNLRQPREAWRPGQWLFDPTHQYWLRACVSWHRFATPSEYRTGFAPDAHVTCDSATAIPTCSATACRAGYTVQPGALIPFTTSRSPGG